MFGGEPQPDEPTVDLKVLDAKIGQLAMENDLLKARFNAGMLSAKRGSTAPAPGRSRARLHW